MTLSLCPRTKGDLVVSILTQLGTRYAVGVPGRCIEPFYDALARADRDQKIKFMTSRHEAAAVAIAEGASRASGNLEVCCATTGPGALNMVGAIVSADFEHVPLLVVTAQTQLYRIGRGAFQDSSDEGVDVVGLFKRVCRYSTLVSHSDQLLPKLRTAWMRAMQYPRGPVHLAIPPEFLSEPCSEQDFAAGMAQTRHWSVPVMFSGEQDTVPALRPFKTAKQPCFVLGNEAILEQHAILEFLEQHPVPVVATAGAVGWFPTDHPCFAGVVGLAGHAHAKHVVQASDAILLLGSYYRDLCVASTPALSTGRTLHVAPTLVSAASTPAGVPLVQASATCVLKALAMLWAARPFPAPPAYPHPEEGALNPVLAPNSPPALLECALAKLGGPQAVFFDAGNAWSWGLHHLSLPRGSRFFLSMGVGQMAWAIPACMGYALADPGRRAVCVTGDGAWLMCSHEVSTAVQYRIPVVFIILNDGHLGMVRHGQAETSPSDAHSVLPEVNFSEMAKVYGLPTYRAGSLEELDTLAPRLAQNCEGPVLLELVVNSEFTPPLAHGVRGPAPIVRNSLPLGYPTVLARD